MTGLAEATQGAVGQPSSVRIGIVDSVSPLAISTQGVVFNDVGILGSYAPTIGDTVALLGQSSGVGSDPASWLALGSVANTAPTPSVRPIAQMRQSLVQSIPNASQTALIWNTTDVDNTLSWNPATPTLWFAPVDGYYALSGGYGYAANVTGFRATVWSIGGSLLGGEVSMPPTTGGNTGTVPARGMIAFMSAGTPVQLNAFQNSGGALNTAVISSQQSTMSIYLLS